jgi:hypothetical protein
MTGSGLRPRDLRQSLSLQFRVIDRADHRCGMPGGGLIMLALPGSGLRPRDLCQSLSLQFRVIDRADHRCGSLMVPRLGQRLRYPRQRLRPQIWMIDDTS